MRATGRGAPVFHSGKNDQMVSASSVLELEVIQNMVGRVVIDENHEKLSDPHTTRHGDSLAYLGQ